MMKKSQLYHLIYKLIQKSKQERKENKQKKHENVRNYYSQFLKKNKLIEKNKGDKIKDIMKSFEEVDSYIDLNDILIAIREHINNENNELQIQQLKHQQQQRKLKKCITQPIYSTTKKYERILQKAQKLIRDSYKQGHYLQLNHCSQIVDNLQSNSTEINNVKYKNNALTNTYHQLMNKKYYEGKKYFVDTEVVAKGISRKNSFVDEVDICSHVCSQTQSITSAYDDKETPWKMLQDRQRNFKILQNFLQNQDASQLPAGLFQLTALNGGFGGQTKQRRKHFDQSKILHSAVVYLHVILQRQHHKKWAYQKDLINQNGQIVIKNTGKSQQNQENQYQIECINKPKINLKSTCSQMNSQCKKYQQEIETNRNFQQFREESHIKQKTCLQFQNVGDQMQENTLYKFANKSCVKNKSLLKSCRNLKDKSMRKLVTITMKTEPNINKFKPILLKPKKTKRPSICRQHTTIDQTQQLSITHPSALCRESNIKKKPRHTLANPQQIQVYSDARHTSIKKTAEKQYLQQKQNQNRKLREKFTFKKRKVKEGVLRKINQFVNDVEHVERTMIIDSKHCEKELDRIRDKMEFQFQTYHTEKFLNDDKALEGVRCALSKQSQGIKRYQSLLKK